MQINYFIAAGGVLWLCGAVQAHNQGNWRMTVVSIAYAISQFALMTAR